MSTNSRQRPPWQRTERVSLSGKPDGDCAGKRPTLLLDGRQVIGDWKVTGGARKRGVVDIKPRPFPIQAKAQTQSLGMASRLTYIMYMTHCCVYENSNP